MAGDFGTDFGFDFAGGGVYDLSGLAKARITIDQMIADQTAGRTKFAGGSQIWVPNHPGAFLAILSVGGGLVATTTNYVRGLFFTVLKAYFDLLVAGAGTLVSSVTGPSATAVATVAARGSLPRFSPYLFPTINAGTPQNTDYDLSGLAAAQTTATLMINNQTSGVTDFAGGQSFQAILTVGGVAQSTTMANAIAMFAALRARFDLLAQ
jgi:hypothetical protein